MTSSVWPPFSSNVTVVTEPFSPPSSFVQTMREGGVTSRYLPKKSMPLPKPRRYLPPVRTSISQERSVMPIDLGTHHFWNSSGLDHASNTRRAGASNVRVTTSSQSDFRCTVVRFMAAGSPCFLASIPLLLPFQFLDDLVQLAEPRVPELVIFLDPRRHFLQPARADPARANPADLLRDDEPGLLEDADVLLHARERHAELLGQIRDRGFRAPQLFQHAAAGDVRQRGEGRIEVGIRI